LKSEVADALCEAGRLGQKTSRGYYSYAADGRTPTPDPEVEDLIVSTSAKLGIARRTISRDEILERLLFPMINEGARILDEGVAARSGDIDVIWRYGYNWPAGKGGPMYYADQIGVANIAKRLAAFADLTGDLTMRPSQLLAGLAAAGEGFASLTVRASAA
jgi:3-hydroxyacyl-CoA dehydrogenase